MQILLLSDTHSYLDDAILSYCNEADEIWHAGDIGSFTVVQELERLKPLRAVYGNIDGEDVRRAFPEDLWFEVEGLLVWMTHIGGYPPRYNQRVRKILEQKQADIFICGHSHILKVVKDDKREGMLCLNPGAVGKQGFHKVRTMLRFQLANKKISNMEVIEMKR